MRRGSIIDGALAKAVAYERLETMHRRSPRPFDTSPRGKSRTAINHYQPSSLLTRMA
jgi:hypothetical protein